VVYSLNMKKYKVYSLKDKNGEIKYIGQTRQTLSRRYNGHKLYSHFKNEYFVIELIADFEDQEPMFYLEAMLIKQYDLINKGWNKTEGYISGKKDFDQSKDNNGFYGHTHSPEIRNKIGERSVGNSYAKDNKSRTGLKNKPEHTQKLIESRQRKVMCLETGEIFKSGREAAEKLNLCRSKISNVCHGKRKSTGGYKFVFVDELSV
jgi:hypothetical protein